MNVSEAIRTKRAIRKFNQDPLPNETIEAILNAGRRAQSAKNMQPWQFIAVREKSTLQTLSKLGHFAGHLAGAPLGIAILTLDPEQRFSILFDAGQAAAYMQLAAWEYGVGSCLATIYEPEAARQLLKFPQKWHLHVAISFGYPDEDELIPRPPRKKGRSSFADTVHWERW
ncbi:MAG: nitroreductase family protein [Anaerolineae bacterium]|nr:nitroreductase family protein [Anaerolineae bacterium]